MPPSIENDAPTKSIGIIYPPPDLRNIVDRTASFVARNGPEFEARIKQNEANNKKFNFLNVGDPYNEYYNRKVKELKEGKNESATTETIVQPAQPTRPQQPNLPVEVAKAVEAPQIPLHPPSDFEFIVEPPSISSINLDLVKITAQFVARNGRRFLTNLLERESKNAQFDFLRPEHSYFNYFTKLLEQYTKILIPPKDLMTKLKEEYQNPQSIMANVKERATWAKHQEAILRREEEEAERERIQYAQIDWHDFVVVEVVDYQPNEHGIYPPPTTPDEVGSRVIAIERYDNSAGMNDDVEMEVESDEEQEAILDKAAGQESASHESIHKKGKDPTSRQRSPSPPPPPPKEAPPLPPPLPPQPDQVLIREDYNPKTKKPAPQPTTGKYLISPLTGEKIPAEKMEEHMRYALLDPKWLEQRDKAREVKENQDEPLAIGQSIEANLKKFAERRTDIFGTGVEEMEIGRKIGEKEDRVPEKVTWDGHSTSAQAATMKARANITIEEQIRQIHKVQGLLPDDEKERIGPSKPGSSVSNAPAPKPVPTYTGAPIRPPVPPPIMPQRAPTYNQPILIRPPPMMQPPQVFHPPMGMPPLPPQPPMPFPTPLIPMPPHMLEEPPAKRQKLEVSLMPEEEFLRTNRSPVTVHVNVPEISDKPEWRLHGQVLTFTLPLTDPVSVLKAQIHQETNVPPGKQKLVVDGIFTKDSNSLAFYNITPNSNIQLQLKERGGRKK